MAQLPPIGPQICHYRDQHLNPRGHRIPLMFQPLCRLSIQRCLLPLHPCQRRTHLHNQHLNLHDSLQGNQVVNPVASQLLFQRLHRYLRVNLVPILPDSQQDSPPDSHHDNLHLILLAQLQPLYIPQVSRLQLLLVSLHQNLLPFQLRNRQQNQLISQSMRLHISPPISLLESQL